MPELPEVETIVRRLSQSLPGSQIIKVDLLWERSLAKPSALEFNKRLHGQTIQRVSRRGKFLRLHLTIGQLLVHLRMSGDLAIKEGPYFPEIHDRLVLGLSGGRSLVFNDTRKFGRIWLTTDPDTVLGSLGPEPLVDEFTARVLFDRLNSRHRQLKPLLLDQSFLAGLGNIYTDEALYRARLHPNRISDSLTLQEVKELWKAIRKVLQEGIKRNGASIDWVYRGGDFQNHFRVYGRAGETCPVCGTIIERIVIGQRGTHFCPNCQPAKDG
jgi:formamidopyrimidine-DNA glycosylase